MRLGHFLLPLIAILPAAANAADNVARCQELAFRIAQAPEIIGTNAQVRSDAQALSRQEAEIRRVQAEMRRNNCNGSIINIGGDDQQDPCDEMSNTLAMMQSNRDAIKAQKQDSSQLVRKVLPEEADIRAEMARLRCSELDLSTVSIAPDPIQPKANRGSIKQIATPSITKIEPKGPPPRQQAKDYGPPPADRPWDPSKPIRSVGPQFYPDANNLDLAHPKD